VAVTIDHVAIPARDPASAARFLADLLDLEVEADGQEGEFQSLRLGAGAALLFVPAAAPIVPCHIALRVERAELDAVVIRLRARNVPFGNDPEDPANTRWEDPQGGYGRVYFVAPDGHLFEVCS